MIEHMFSTQRLRAAISKRLPSTASPDGKVEQIRASIEAGIYYIPSGQVAEKIISVWRHVGHNSCPVRSSDRPDLKRGKLDGSHHILYSPRWRYAAN